MPQLICRESGESYPIHETRWKSESGGLLDIQFRPNFDPQKVKYAPPSLWRYRDALPLDEEEEIVSLQEGFTPMVSLEIGHKTLLLKLDYLFPSGSYKDRGATVLMTHAKALGVEQVVQDSSGNAGCAIANYAALAGINCKIFVPENTSSGKLAQIRLHGAELIKVPGSREETARITLLAAEDTYYASHVWNPFFFQGTKTFAYEVCEQLGWQAPDTVILPAGNGTLLLGAYIGFSELQEAGIIAQVPRLIGVQAQHCDPLVQAFRYHLKNIPVIEKKDTLAEGISIANPARGDQMLQYVRETQGHFIAVEESEIKEALLELGKRGFYVEPTSAAVYAGALKYIRTQAQHDERMVSVLTGSGLKSTDKILKMLA
ncbi:MAG: threonine synthase [Microscillaceae bacterium]|nr:threonine synthase [Microscillaceae bacterium]